MLSRELVEAEYAPIYDTYGLGIMCYSPLAGGLLTGTAALHLARSLINSTVGRLAGCRWACVVCATESGW